MKLGDARATGTIHNSDPMPTAWMVRLGRAIGSQIVQGVSDRLHGTGSSHLSIGGMEVDNSRGDDSKTSYGQSLASLDRHWDEQDNGPQTMTPGEMLRQSAFHWSNAGTKERSHPSLSTWGRFATGGFEGKENLLAMDADVTTGLLGVDAKWQRGLAGVVLAWTESSGTYRNGSEDTREHGEVDASVAGMYPYASVSLNERIFAWGLIGAGSGELTLKPRDARQLPTDLALRIGAVGLSGEIVDGSGAWGIELNAKSDLMWVSTRNRGTEDLIATSGDVSRVRLGLQGRRVFETGNGGTFIPDIEMGLRQDSGDAETGTGFEIGTGARYTAGTLSVEGRVRALIAHEESDYEEWGASGTLELTPGRSGRGLSLSIAPQWGWTESRIGQLWSQPDTGLKVKQGAQHQTRIALQAGYGLGLGADHGVLTPYAGVTLSNGAKQTVRGGARWKLGPELEMNIEAVHEDPGSEPVFGLWARTTLRF